MHPYASVVARALPGEGEQIVARGRDLGNGQRALAMNRRAALGLPRLSPYGQAMEHFADDRRVSTNRYADAMKA